MHTHTSSNVTSLSFEPTGPGGAKGVRGTRDVTSLSLSQRWIAPYAIDARARPSYLLVDLRTLQDPPSLLLLLLLVAAGTRAPDRDKKQHHDRRQPSAQLVEMAVWLPFFATTTLNIWPIRGRRVAPVSGRTGHPASGHSGSLAANLQQQRRLLLRTCHVWRKNSLFGRQPSSPL